MSRYPREIDRPREVHYRWVWDLPAASEALWPLVSDTNRFDRDAGLPPVRVDEAAQAGLVNGRRRASLSLLGMNVTWDEEPFDWVRPRRFGVVRRYHGGPMAEMRVLAELEPLGEARTRVDYRLWIRSGSALGRVLIPLQIGWITRKHFERTFRQYAEMAAGAKPADESLRPVRLAPGARARIARVCESLRSQGCDMSLLRRMVELIERGDDLRLAHLRPYALADAWGIARRQALELFPQATRAGLLNFRWELLCPLCRGAKDRSATLRDLSMHLHCDVCRIDASANFDRLVELTFRPNAAIREVEERQYCVGGPQLTPHVVVQQLLAAGERRVIAVPFEPGRYRVRTLGLPGGQLFAAGGAGDAATSFCAMVDGWPDDERVLALRSDVTLENQTPDDQLFIIERTAWSDQALTATEVFALQTFRDLFSQEALRPGERVSVGSLTVVFTDLRGSTHLYRQIGDAPAFGRVLDHFAILKDAISAEQGTVVKTMGDAVMAVFRRPVAALRALTAAQRLLAAPNDGSPPLLLKCGIHHGPCIAVTLNERLDYFGSTVNITARLEALSDGHDMVASSSVVDDAEVRAWLAEAGGQYLAEPFEATLRGLEPERFDLVRIFPKNSAV